MAYTFPPKDGRTFPPKDDRPSSSYFSPNSSSHSYFTDQAIRSGYRVPVDSREPEFHRYPNDMTDPVEREIEKDRIRAEIMAEEQMERRRILEEEVRRELMLEREITLQRWDSSRMRFDPPSDFRQFEHQPSRIPQPLGHFEERRLPLLPTVPSHHPVVGVGILGSPPFQHHPMPPPATSNLVMREIKPFPEPRKERTLLAKREANVSGLDRKGKSSTLESDHHRASNLEKKPEKREANVSGLDRKRKSSTLESDHHRASNLEKKPKGRWSCDLCKISTTSEKALNDHMKGKKHKLMEEEQAPLSTGFNSNPVMMKEFTLNTDKPGPSHPNVKKTTKPYVKLSETETPRAKATIVDDKKKTSRMNDSLKIQEQRPATTPGNVGSVKVFKFWCEVCKVGVNSEVVLSDHKKGRRHLENLELKAAPSSEKKFGNAQGVSSRYRKKEMKH